MRCDVDNQLRLTIAVRFGAVRCCYLGDCWDYSSSLRGVIDVWGFRGRERERETPRNRLSLHIIALKYVWMIWPLVDFVLRWHSLRIKYFSYSMNADKCGPLYTLPCRFLGNSHYHVKALVTFNCTDQRTTELLIVASAPLLENTKKKPYEQNHSKYLKRIMNVAVCLSVCSTKNLILVIRIRQILYPRKKIP